MIFGVVALLGQQINDRRKGRDVPNHRHGAVFRMQRQRNSIGLRHCIDRRAPRRVHPVVGNALLLGRTRNLGVVRVEDERELGLVQVLFIGRRRRLGHAVGVIEEQSEVAQPADTGLRTHRGQALFDPRVAESALFGLTGFVVEIDLLVGATRDALAPTAALVLVDQDDAVLFTFVDRTRGARRYARWAVSYTHLTLPTNRE